MKNNSVLRTSVKIRRIFFVFVWFIASGFLLGGCDQFKSIDAMQRDVAANQKRVSELAYESINSRQQVVNLASEIAAIKEKLAALETMQSKAAKPASNDPPTIPNEQVASLKGSIAQCVEVVKKLKDSHPIGTLIENEVYINFDAYFNPATGRVLNNNHFVDQSAVYAFNKCMVSQGWPMK